jgi:L-threonylcarbamoyladenylate synthase
MLFTTQTGTDVTVARTFLQAGECVAIPTETVYGLAANALDENAVLKIFETKNRPQFDPLIVHVHSIAAAAQYVTNIPAKAKLLMHEFWPGPLTILLPKKNIIPDIVTSGLDTVAVRMPGHSLTLALLQQLPFPLAAPSANPFGYISPTTAQHVHDQLQNKIPYILDGGAANVGVESTIIGFENDTPVIYRLGGLEVEAIEKIIGKVHVQLNESSNPKSPGMLKSHYAPKKKLIFNPTPVVNAPGVVVITFDKYITGFTQEQQYLLSPSGNLHEAAHNLFAVMRQADNSNATLIIAMPFPEEGLGLAINDRLRRAAAAE